jgi:hypothetical protein
MAETELHDVPGLTEDQVARLGKSWINSAEQLVAISATSGGIQSLAQQLHVSETEARRLIALARAVLTPEAQSEMGQRFDSDDRGMGARSPREDATPTDDV